jgi:hypothetical protein
MAKFAYPYPVLGSDDSIEGKFNISLKIRRAESKMVNVKVENIKIDNDEISSMLKKEECRIIFRIYCGSTFYSDSFVLNDKTEITLPEDMLVNKVEAEVLIVLNKSMIYELASFKDEFAGMSFNLNRNDVIGVTDVLKWDVPRAYEKLVSNSIFKFTMRTEESDPTLKDFVTFNFDNDDIHVIYPFHKDIDPLSALFRKKMYTAYWSVIIPALTEGYRLVITDDDEEKSEYENYRWFHYLEQVMKVKGINSQNPFEIAQVAFVEDGFKQMFEELS